MAVLTDDEKVKIRREIARIAAENSIPVSWVKGAIHDAAQVFEDILASAAFKTQVSDDMDTATSPYGITFTNQQKKWIGAMVMYVNYVRDLV